MTRTQRKPAVKNRICREALRSHAKISKMVEEFGHARGVLHHPHYKAVLETLREVGHSLEALGRRADLESSGAASSN